MWRRSEGEGCGPCCKRLGLNHEQVESVMNRLNATCEGR